MSPRAILRLAYALDLVPHELHGKTQHKTLQARLSEDIIYLKERSAFFRTKPGTFFLRRFITDNSIPVDYRREMKARRRSRDLLKGPALSVELEELRNLNPASTSSEARSALEKIRSSSWFRYIDPKKPHPSQALIWSFASVMRDKCVLTYRIGRYRDNRDNFSLKRSIGFSSLVVEENRSLFDELTFGIEESALAAVAVDLNIPFWNAQAPDDHFVHSLKFLTCTDDPTPNLLAFIKIKAPSWFEPTAFRLSLNDLRWMDLSAPPNNIEDFDPWSQLILNEHFAVLSADA